MEQTGHSLDLDSGGSGAPVLLEKPRAISPQEPWVHLTVGNHLIDFLLDPSADGTDSGQSWEGETRDSTKK